MTLGKFPQTRLRRNRKDAWCRDLVAETRLSVKDLVWPIFVCEDNHPRAIDPLPGVVRYSLEELKKVAEFALKSGIPAIDLFSATPQEKKCSEGLEALNPCNLQTQAVQMLKSEFPELGIMTDIALDAYTSHGHDGVLRGNDVANDETSEILSKMAVMHAEAGVDVIAPSDMMDGRIGTIRHALDRAGFQHVRILAYSAKYASAFYGPFRDALGSAPSLGKGDKKTYQMDPANLQEALREAAQDIQEGADMIMVKPGLPYLDVIRKFKDTFHMPIFAYHVSGEYAMLKAAAQNGWLDYNRALLETMIAFKRAGADGILTYAAPEIVKLLKD
ncbi:porphobilinogen synthase [Candidatus Bealeia paramacronuclearis]|uniref:porphobilinogen synthase n=1 Tax=Candidatus Bealeia paramacronuclearis TaxID=1921001 RepID=UPI0039C4E194